MNAKHRGIDCGLQPEPVSNSHAILKSASAFEESVRADVQIAVQVLGTLAPEPIKEFKSVRKKGTGGIFFPVAKKMEGMGAAQVQNAFAHYFHHSPALAPPSQIPMLSKPTSAAAAAKPATTTQPAACSPPPSMAYVEWNPIPTKKSAPEVLKPAEFLNSRAVVTVNGAQGWITVLLTLRNPNNAKLNGKLKIPLPEGVSVRFGIRSGNDKMRLAVAVEKEKAAIAFEAAKKEEGTASLSTVDAGNVNSTDFSVDANATVTFSFEFVCEALSDDRHMWYWFPMMALPLRGTFQMVVISHSASDKEKPPILRLRSNDEKVVDCKFERLVAKGPAQVKSVVGAIGWAASAAAAVFGGSAAHPLHDFLGLSQVFKKEDLEDLTPELSSAIKAANEMVSGSANAAVWRGFSEIKSFAKPNSNMQLGLLLENHGRTNFTSCGKGETGRRDGYFLTSQFCSGAKPTALDKGPQGGYYAILWDTSLSRKDRNVAAEKRFVNELLKHGMDGDWKAVLIRFNAVASEPQILGANNIATFLTLFDPAVVYDGASNITDALNAVLSAHKKYRFSHIFMFTDGVETVVHEDLLAKGMIPKDMPSISIINSSMNAARDRMRAFATKANGSFIDLSDGPITEAKTTYYETAVSQVLNPNAEFRFLEYECDPPAAIRDVYMQKHAGIVGGARVTIGGRIQRYEATTVQTPAASASATQMTDNAKSAKNAPIRLLLRFGYSKEQPLSTVTVELSPDVMPVSEIADEDTLNRVESGGHASALSYWWATRHARHLSSLPSFRNDLLYLARQHRLITEHTSLLILPDVQSHIRHHIPPADAAELKLYNQARGAQMTKEVKNAVNHLTTLANDHATGDYQTANGLWNWREMVEQRDRDEKKRVEEEKKRAAEALLNPKPANNNKPSTGGAATDIYYVGDVEMGAASTATVATATAGSTATVATATAASHRVITDSLESLEVQSDAVIRPLSSRSMRVSAAAASAPIREYASRPESASAASASAAPSGGSSTASADPSRASATTLTIAPWKSNKPFYEKLDTACALPPLPDSWRTDEKVRIKRAEVEQAKVMDFEQHYSTIVKEKCDMYLIIGAWLMAQSEKSINKEIWVGLADRVVSNISELHGTDPSAVRGAQLWYEAHAEAAGSLKVLFLTRCVDRARYNYRMMPNDTHTRWQFAQALKDRVFTVLRDLRDSKTKSGPSALAITVTTPTASELKQMANDIIAATRLLLEAFADTPTSTYPNLDALCIECCIHTVTAAQHLNVPTGITPQWLEQEFKNIIHRRALLLAPFVSEASCAALQACAKLNFMRHFGRSVNSVWSFPPIDCAIHATLFWDRDANDQDMHVEYNGETVSYGHKLSHQQKHMISSDFTQGRGPEVYRGVFAKPGEYKLQTNFYGQSSQSPSVQGDVSEMAVFTLDYGGVNEIVKKYWKQLSDNESGHGSNKGLKLVATATVV
jgi:hypothetical protein